MTKKEYKKIKKWIIESYEGNNDILLLGGPYINSIELEKFIDELYGKNIR